jgi:hypothetical protein
MKKERLKNLKKGAGTKFRSGGEAANFGKKGEKRSGEVRREKKTFAELAEQVFELKAGKAITDQIKIAYPSLDLASANVKSIAVLGLAARAMKGDVAAFSKLQELARETRADEDEKLRQAQAPILENKIYDFETFCKNASYPAPFEKQKEFVAFAFSGGYRMVEASRGYGKTDYVAILKPAYEIYKDKTKTFIIVNKDRKKASSAVKEIARCLEANGVLLETNNAFYLRTFGLTGKQDNAIALGIKQSLKQNHADYIICDGKGAKRKRDKSGGYGAQRV